MPPFTVFYRKSGKLDWFTTSDSNEIVDFYEELPIDTEIITIQDRLGYSILIEGVHTCGWGSN